MSGHHSSAATNKPVDMALQQSRFLKACRREQVDKTPIWLMRQAGRFMPEYREIRARTSFLELCKNSDLAAEVTVMAVEQLGVDAAIIFADILLPLEVMGVGLKYEKGDGPVIGKPVRTIEDVRSLKPVEPKEDLAYVMRSLQIARASLPADIPLIGFAGAPFTLASYLIEGGASRHFDRTKTLMYNNPAAWAELMEFIADMTGRYLNAQIESGAQAVQIFDSWVGCLGQADYTKYVLPYVSRTLSGIKHDVPVIHFGTGNPTLLPLMRQAGGTVIGVDWRIDIDGAFEILPGITLQGNLDPISLLAEPDVVAERALDVLRRTAGRQGYIFNLGHGILPQTPVDNVKRLVSVVHEWSS